MSQQVRASDELDDVSPCDDEKRLKNSSCRSQIIESAHYIQFSSMICPLKENNGSVGIVPDSTELVLKYNFPETSGSKREIS